MRALVACGVVALVVGFTWQPGAPALPSLSAAALDTELRASLEAYRRQQAAEQRACAGVSQLYARYPRAQAPDSTMVVVGEVFSGGGQPLAQAQVYSQDLSRSVASTIGGRFELRIPRESLTAGREVDLRARAIGYRPASQRVVLRPADSAVLTFQLCRDVNRLSEVSVNGARHDPTELTNVQTAGVDEGGIVKRHGEHLVILRRGRLFTVRLGRDRLAPVAVTNAFPEGLDPDEAWYDEMLVDRDIIVVIGYRYDKGTELSRFRIGADGAIAHLDTYHLGSNDYYSSSNYASRLVRGRLVFYAPHHFEPDAKEPLGILPELRRWTGSAARDGFAPLELPRRMYRLPGPTPAAHELAMHTVTSCDITAPTMSCEGTAVLGPGGRVFYVSARAAYVWTSHWHPRTEFDDVSTLVRIPLDDAAPSAVRVRGAPIDQFSFLEERDGFVNVLVTADGTGEGMWRSERPVSRLELLRLPPTVFGDGRGRLDSRLYRRLPGDGDGIYTNRFIGDHLLYGTGEGWGVPKDSGATLVVVPFRGGEPASFRLPHFADRIEAMGRQAIVIGPGREHLFFTGVRLSGTPQVVQRFWMTGAQGETRSHGFFYRADGETSGVIGLPVRDPGSAGWEQLFTASGGVVFLRNDGRQLEPLGTLAGRDTTTPDDGCVASCVDWYGNSRPLFIGDRVFALIGYEIIEGRLARERIGEVGRVSFAPRR